MNPEYPETARRLLRPRLASMSGGDWAPRVSVDFHGCEDAHLHAIGRFARTRKEHEATGGRSRLVVAGAGRLVDRSLRRSLGPELGRHVEIERHPLAGSDPCTPRHRGGHDIDDV